MYNLPIAALATSIVLLTTPLFAQETGAQEAITATTATLTDAPKPATGTANTMPPKPESNTKLSGRVFANLSRRSNLDFAGTTDKTRRAGGNGTGVDLKRFYFGVKHTFDKTWSAEFVSDIGDQNRRYDLFVKKAYFEAKLADEAIFRVGSANMPWAAFIDELWGYRYLENVLVDRLKFGTTADWGIHFLGEAFDGFVNYAISGINGGGYSNPSRPESQDLDFEARVGIEPIEGLNVAVGGYRGKLAKDAPTLHTAERLNAVASYATQQFRVGAEAFRAINWTSVDRATEDAANGYAVWAGSVLIDPVYLIARFDWAKPRLGTNRDLFDRYGLAALEWKVNKAVKLALAYKTEFVDGGQVSASNGTVGTAAAGESGRYQEYGLWGQYQF